LPTPLPTLTVSLDDALADLTSAYEVAGRSPQTTSLFTLYIGHLSAFLAQDGIRDIADVTTAMLTRFLRHEQGRGLKPASISVILRTLRRYFAWCVEQGHLTSNPARGVMAPSITVEPVRFLSDEQLDTLLKSIAKDKTIEGVRDTALIRVLMDTGLRRGEVMGLRTTDWSEVDHTLTVRAQTSKMRRGRPVGVSQKTAQALRTYLKYRAAYLARLKRQDDALWISAKGSLSPNGALQALRRRLKAAGLPQVTMHSLRHGWAARAIEDGLAMPYLMALGGWSSPAMPTARYGQFEIGGRALKAMQDMLDRRGK
jgi:site-specific recombinase XerD